MKAQLIDINLSGTKTIHIKNVEQFFLNAPFHFHHLCELVWIEKSFGKRIIGDNIDNFEDGDLVLMGPNLPHIWQNDEIFTKKKKGYRAKATVIYFPTDFLLTLTDDQDIIVSTQKLINKSSRGLKIFGETHKKITLLLKGIGEEKGLKKIIHFLQIIDTLSQSKDYEYLASITYRNHYDEKDTGRINNVYQFLMHNFHRNIELKEVSSLCHMTPNAFCRYFKSRTQKSFTFFLNELRIGHACKLLQNVDYSVSDVFYECGYNNPTNFNKFFKSFMGTTPKEYKKKIQVPIS